MNSPEVSAAPWWSTAVIYQIYPRSFADGNGDGMGDLPGVTSRLDYLAKLGIDAIWLSPFYRSPQADAGYDVADYREVDPRFGTLADFDEMLSQAHARGLKVIVDLVPNHTSDEHVWFQEALASPEGSPERNRYWFREGKGEHGELPPNNWQSIFGGPAWTRITGADGQPGQWYLHLFDTKQPDLNWANPEVLAEMESVIRFWLDRGVDGFRVDVAHGMVKDPALPDYDGHQAMVEGAGESGDSITTPPPFFDQDGVHDIYRELHKILNEYSGDRMMVAEAWVEPAERLARYVRADEMQQAFNFDYLMAGWDARRIAEAIAASRTAMSSVGAPSTWVISNHDTVRAASRYGLSNPTSRPNGISADDEQPNEALGLRRARAAAALEFALPGSAYIYQGDELGLPDHTSLPASARQDPSFFRTNGAEIGRDGARVPLPWSHSEPSLGFSPEGSSAESWLPQPESFARYTAEEESRHSDSTLNLYRNLLNLRARYNLGEGDYRLSDSYDPETGVLGFINSDVEVLANLGVDPIVLPEQDILLRTEFDDEVVDGHLAANAAVWLKRA